MKKKTSVLVLALTLWTSNASSELPTTVKLGNAPAKDYKIEDADHDGNDDITLKFNVNEIGLTSDTTELTMTGQTVADDEDSPDVIPDVPMNFTGTDHVTVKK